MEEIKHTEEYRNLIGQRTRLSSEILKLDKKIYAKEDILKNIRKK